MAIEWELNLLLANGLRRAVMVWDDRISRPNSLTLTDLQKAVLKQELFSLDDSGLVSKLGLREPLPGVNGINNIMLFKRMHLGELRWYTVLDVAGEQPLEVVGLEWKEIRVFPTASLEEKNG